MYNRRLKKICQQMWGRWDMRRRERGEENQEHQEWVCHLCAYSGSRRRYLRLRSCRWQTGALILGLSISKPKIFTIKLSLNESDLRLDRAALDMLYWTRLTISPSPCPNHCSSGLWLCILTLPVFFFLLWPTNYRPTQSSALGPLLSKSSWLYPPQRL